MINIAICDDEVYMLNLLTEKVLGFFKQENMEIAVFPFQSGKALLDCDKKLDIVFLDIQMGEPDGLETAKELRGRGYGGFLIFITVLQEYVFNAFEVQAFDYLVKPLQEDNFSRTMSRLLLSIRSHKGKQLLIQKGTEWSIVPFDDIVYCEIINRKTWADLTQVERNKIHCGELHFKAVSNGTKFEWVNGYEDFVNKFGVVDSNKERLSV